MLKSSKRKRSDSLSYLHEDSSRDAVSNAVGRKTKKKSKGVSESDVRDSKRKSLGLNPSLQPCMPDLINSAGSSASPTIASDGPSVASSDTLVDLPAIEPQKACPEKIGVSSNFILVFPMILINSSHQMKALTPAHQG